MFQLTMFTKVRLIVYAFTALLVSILMQVIGPQPEAGPTTKPSPTRQLPVLIDNLANRGSGR